MVHVFKVYALSLLECAEMTYSWYYLNFIIVVCLNAWEHVWLTSYCLTFIGRVIDLHPLRARVIECAAVHFCSFQRPSSNIDRDCSLPSVEFTDNIQTLVESILRVKCKLIRAVNFWKLFSMLQESVHLSTQTSHQIAPARSTLIVIT